MEPRLGTCTSVQSGVSLPARLLTNCIPDDVPEEILHREMKCTDDIRVELVMKDALSMYHRLGADVSDIYILNRG